MKAPVAAKRPRAGSDAGFTMTELLVALTILAVGILSVGRMFIFSQRHAYFGRAETTAVTLAEEIREKIMSDNYDDLISIFDGVDTANSETITAPCQLWADHVSQQLGVSGRGEVLVLDHDEDPEIQEGMLTIDITVSWEENGQTRSVDMRFATCKMGV